MSGKIPSVLLVGIGGYGNTIVEALLGSGDVGRFRIAGVADPVPEGCRRVGELRRLGLPFYPDPASFYRRHAADLAVIAAPIAFHAEYTCIALEHGSHVLCEKPLAATIQDARAMQRARDAAGRFVAVGYQWSFSAAITALKRDILAGAFGRAKRLRTLVLWPRDFRYYHRNDWAGAVRDRAGRWVLDSPVNNATAHYLHNMFYVLGSAPESCALPVRVQAELYRANPIGNYDTGVCRAATAEGAEILFYSSHAVEVQRGPEFVYEFEKGVVTYSPESGTIRARWADGAVRDYGDPNQDPMRKLQVALEAAAGEGRPAPACGIEAAVGQTLCMNGMQDSGQPIQEFAPERIRSRGRGEQCVTYVDGLAAALTRAFERGALPSEMNLPWAVPGRTIDLSRYSTFPGG